MATVFRRQSLGARWCFLLSSLKLSAFFVGFPFSCFFPTESSAAQSVEILSDRGQSSESPNGDAEIQGEFRNSTIRIRTTQRLAGAIDSIQWNGKEFIDSYDHGRQLQSASSFDAGQSSPFWSERFNPTEAGSSRDGTGNKSTSKLLHIEVEPRRLKTKIDAAFWLAPGESSGGFPALNQKEISNHVIAKDVQIGLETNGRLLPNVIDYRVTFQVPSGESHQFAQFEALTGYMPPEFSEFWGFNNDSKQLVPLDDGPGEQSMPIVFSTPSGEFAMGCLCAVFQQKKYQGPGYGRFRFLNEKVVKWNCVFRLSNTAGIDAGEYSFRIFVPIGTREDVRLAIQHLIVNPN
ncbi:MAG: hypothetical protein ACK5YR_02030 [Pirellula sp.]